MAIGLSGVAIIILVALVVVLGAFVGLVIWLLRRPGRSA
jgi:uncharacterized iron-regulated membrane protein